MIDLYFISQECFWQLEQKTFLLIKSKAKWYPAWGALDKNASYTCVREQKRERNYWLARVRLNPSRPRVSGVLWFLWHKVFFIVLCKPKRHFSCCHYFGSFFFVFFWLFGFSVFLFYFFVFHSRMFFGDQKRKACLLISIKSLNDGT